MSSLCAGWFCQFRLHGSVHNRHYIRQHSALCYAFPVAKNHDVRIVFFNEQLGVSFSLLEVKTDRAETTKITARNLDLRVCANVCEIFAGALRVTLGELICQPKTSRIPTLWQKHQNSSNFMKTCRSSRVYGVYSFCGLNSATNKTTRTFWLLEGSGYENLSSRGLPFGNLKQRRKPCLVGGSYTNGPCSNQRVVLMLTLPRFWWDRSSLLEVSRSGIYWVAIGTIFFSLGNQKKGSLAPSSFGSILIWLIYVHFIVNFHVFVLIPTFRGKNPPFSPKRIHSFSAGWCPPSCVCWFINHICIH